MYHLTTTAWCKVGFLRTKNSPKYPSQHKGSRTLSPRRVRLTPTTTSLQTERGCGLPAVLCLGNVLVRSSLLCLLRPESLCSSVGLQPPGFNWLSLSIPQWESHFGAPGSPLSPGTALTCADKQNVCQLNNKVQMISRLNANLKALHASDTPFPWQFWHAW